MAGQFKNQEKGYPGTTIVLDAAFRAFEGGPLTNTDALPTYTIYNPSNVVASSGTATQTGTGTYEASFAIPSNATLSNAWRIEWTAAINGQAINGALEYFCVHASPGTPVINFGDKVIISDTFLNQVKKVLAFPMVQGVILYDEDIKELCVFPAMQAYFTKFPRVERDQMSVVSYLEVPFPDDLTFGVMDVRTVNKFSRTTSSFWDIIKFRNMYGYTGNNSRWGGQYGTRFNYNFATQNLFTKKQAADAISNEATYTYNVNYETRNLEVFSSSSCDLLIGWAKYSYDFANVKYTYQFDVVKLAQAHLLYHLADTGGMVTDSALEKQIAVDSLRTRAEGLMTEVMDKWKEIPDVILIRGA